MPRDLLAEAAPRDLLAESNAVTPTLMDNLANVGFAVGHGFFGGGPMGAIAGGTREGLRQAGNALDSAAYNAGGAATDIAAKFVSPEVAAGLGYGTNVAVQAIPTVLGGQAGKVASPALEGTAKWLMQSALKPTWEALRTGKATRAIDTMLEEGINPTKGGMEKLRPMIETLDQQIKTAIANSPATINKGEVGKSLQETFDRFKNQVNPQADLETIKNAWLGFRNHPLLAGKEEIPVQIAQQMKQGTYRILADKYGEEGAALTEAQKALARGLKEQISAAVPGVAQVNNRVSDLLNVLNIAERRAYMDPNKNPLNLALLAHNPSTFMMFLADKSALLKSLAARGLYSGSQSLPALAGAAGGGYYGALIGQEPPQGALYPR